MSTKKPAILPCRFTIHVLHRAIKRKMEGPKLCYSQCTTKSQTQEDFHHGYYNTGYAV